MTSELLAAIECLSVLQTLLSGGEPWHGTGCASGVGSVCTVSPDLMRLVHGTHLGRMECGSLSFLLHS